MRFNFLSIVYLYSAENSDQKCIKETICFLFFYELLVNWK